MNPALQSFLHRHEAQFGAMGLPKTLWGVCAEKILRQQFDAGEYVQFAERDIEQVEEARSTFVTVATNNELQSRNEAELTELWHSTRYNLVLKTKLEKFETVVLIDHMWTTTFPQSREHLRSIEGLQERIASMLGLGLQAGGTEDINIKGREETVYSNVDLVWRSMWPHMNCYALPGDDYTRWYLMDEVGTSIGHSPEPNFCCCPLLVVPEGQPPFGMSLLWPISDCEEGEEVSRNYLPGVPLGDPSRSLRLVAFLDEAALTNQALISDLIRVHGQERDEAHILNDDCNQHTVVEEWQEAMSRLDAAKQGKRPLRIYIDNRAYMTPDMISRTDIIQLVETPEEADAFFLVFHTVDEKEERELDKTGIVLNQFWWDGMVVSKEHLVRTVRTAHPSEKLRWFPSSYDLSIHSQLVEFVEEFLGTQNLIHQKETKEAEADNIWILKKYRGRHSIDYPITSSLSCALRHLESCPRIASKYVTSPACYIGRKFDLRYYIVVLSLEPLRLYRHPLFNVRLANLPYSTEDLETYQKHFTVMSLLDDAVIGDVRGGGIREDPYMGEFKLHFDQEQKTEGSGYVSWEQNVQPLVDDAISKVFQGVQKIYQKEPPHPSGKRLHPNAGWSLNQPNKCFGRAMYGVDVIFTKDLQPMILEVQWAPDCDRALKFHSTFWDDILCALFLEEVGDFVKLE